VAASMFMHAGMSYGHKVLHSGREKLFPKYLTWLEGLKFYFRVNNSYVLNKIKVLLFPFRRRWRRQTLQDESFGATTKEALDDGGYNFLPPADDINSPDLYIPVMAFVSYVVLAGAGIGLKGLVDFSPDLFFAVASSAILVFLLEFGAIRLGVHLSEMNQIWTWDLACWSGYKFVLVCFGVILRLLFHGTNLPFPLLLLCLLYLAGSYGWFYFNTLATHAGAHEIANCLPTRRVYFLYLIAAVQIPLCLWLIRRAF